MSKTTLVHKSQIIDPSILINKTIIKSPNLPIKNALYPALTVIIRNQKYVIKKKDNKPMHSQQIKQNSKSKVIKKIFIKSTNMSKYVKNLIIYKSKYM